MTDILIFLESLALLVINCIFQYIDAETMRHNEIDITFYKLTLMFYLMFCMVIKQESPYKFLLTKIILVLPLLLYSLVPFLTNTKGFFSVSKTSK